MSGNPIRSGQLRESAMRGNASGRTKIAVGSPNNAIQYLNFNHMINVVSDTISGRFVPEIVSPARAALERSRFPHCEAINRKSYEMKTQQDSDHGITTHARLREGNSIFTKML